MSKIELFAIGFGRPDLLREQKRLLDKYLEDDFGFCLVDNTPTAGHAALMEETCRDLDIGYLRAHSRAHQHPDALNLAALHVTRTSFEFFGFLDHDVFPRRPTTLIDKVEGPGFYGVGQTHPATGNRYLWPGFCFFSRKWLAGRQLDFRGIRGAQKRDDGDCGSMNWPLFTEVDWHQLWGMEHGYQAVREPDEHGLQSWGIEILGDWLHCTNGSHWKEVPAPEERDRVLRELVASL